MEAINHLLGPVSLLGRAGAAHESPAHDQPTLTLKLNSLPALVLERIAHCLRFSSFTHGDHAREIEAQRSLLALSLTCKTLHNAATPILYKTPIVTDLLALTPFDRTLHARADLAAHVHGLIAGSTFSDAVCYDTVALIYHTKWREGSGVPSPARFSQLGPNLPRTILMAWFTHFAHVCPHLKAIDWSRANDLHSSTAIGFGNLAQILRQRGGSFQGPQPMRTFPLSAVLITDPKYGNKTGVPYFVSGIDWDLKCIDVYNTMFSNHIWEYNLHAIEDLIPGGRSEMARWTIRNVTLMDPVDKDPFDEFTEDLAGPKMDMLAISKDAYIFDVTKQRYVHRPKQAKSSRPASPASASSASGSSKNKGKSQKKGGGKGGKGGKGKAGGSATSGKTNDSSAVLVAGTGPSAPSLGTLSLWTVHIGSVDSVLTRRGYLPSQLIQLKLRYPPMLEQERMFMLEPILNTHFSNSVLAMEKALFPNLASLFLGVPWFTQNNTSGSLQHLPGLAACCPNLESLTIESSHAAIGDILYLVDPFVRRSPSQGKRLLELVIVRRSPFPGIRQVTSLPHAVVNSAPSFTKLHADRATPGHLRKLILTDDTPVPPGSKYIPSLILIHPGVLYGIEYLNIRGTRIAMSPPTLCTPDSPTFPPLATTYFPTDMRPLGELTLPILRSLAVNADLELATAEDDPEIDNLDQLLPEAPGLTSLLVHCKSNTYFSRAGFVLDVLDLYAGSLRNACFTETRLPMTSVYKLAAKLFKEVDPETRQRLAPHLSRFLLVNREPPAGHMRVFALGDLARTWMSDLDIGHDAVPGGFKLRPAMLSYGPYTASEALVKNKGLQPGSPCECGRYTMGQRRDELGTKVWASVTQGCVVCRECVAAEENSVVRNVALGVDLREVKHMTQIKEDVQTCMSDGVWGMGEWQLFTTNIVG